MSLDQIKKGEAVVLDANIFLYASYGHSAQCARLVERCFRRELHGIFPLHIVAEMNHRLMCSEARHLDGGAFSNPARQLAANPDKVKALAGTRNMIQNILAGDFEIAALEVDDMADAVEIQARHGLLTNDALLLALCRRLGLENIASSDQCFRDIPRINLFAPSDLFS